MFCSIQIECPVLSDSLERGVVSIYEIFGIALKINEFIPEGMLVSTPKPWVHETTNKPHLSLIHI